MRGRGWLAAGLAGVVGVAAVGAVLWARVPAPPPTVAPSSAAGRAEASLAALLYAFRMSWGGLSTHPGRGGHHGVLSTAGPTAVWGYTWALAAAEDVAQIPGAPASAKATVRSLANGLALYWDARAKTPAYAPYPFAGPRTTKYFDDNAWAGLDLVGAYRLTGDRAFLAQAEKVLRYERTLGIPPVVASTGTTSA